MIIQDQDRSDGCLLAGRLWDDHCYPYPLVVYMLAGLSISLTATARILGLSVTKPDDLARLKDEVRAVLIKAWVDVYGEDWDEKPVHIDIDLKHEADAAALVSRLEADCVGQSSEVLLFAGLTITHHAAYSDESGEDKLSGLLSILRGMSFPLEEKSNAEVRDMKPDEEIEKVETDLGRPLTDDERALVLREIESIEKLERHRMTDAERLRFLRCRVAEHEMWLIAESEAQDLNRRDIPSPLGGRWEAGDVMNIAGRLVEFLKRQERMGPKWRTDPPILHPPADEEAEPTTVWTFYELSRHPELNDDLSFAIGQYCDMSGAGGGYREIGWNCYTDEEVLQVSRIIEGFGLPVTVGDSGPAFALAFGLPIGETH